MSNHLAIATVTATLYNILFAGKETGTTVSTVPPDKARENGNGGDQVNVFLYHTAVNASLRNMPPPHEIRSGESGHPPLALQLFYLVTAYGANDDDIAAHRILGRAMSNLHDHPILGPGEFEGANATLAESDLHQQVERVRITPEPLSLDDMFKLWSTFQTQYRPSAAYQVSVVLIDSQRPPRAPLPVLRRGTGAQADLVPPFPALTGVTPPNQQPAARIGDTVTLAGHHLAGDGVDVLFRHPRREEPIVLAPEAGPGDTELRVVLPAAPPEGPGWTAGVYTVSAVIHRAGEEDRTTNELPLALSPRITSITPNPADLDTVSVLTVGCQPAALHEHKPRLLLGEHVLAPQAFTDPAASLDFSLAGIAAGSYFVRLRIAGVDSLLIDYAQTPPLFDATQEVTLTSSS